MLRFKVLFSVIFLIIFLTVNPLFVQGQQYGLIKGKVIDTEGRPIAGATVIAYDMINLRLSNSNKTNAYGEYSLSLLQGFKYRFYVFVKIGETYTYIPAFVPSPNGTEYEVTVGEKENELPPVTLYPAATIKLVGPIYSAKSNERATGVMFEVVKHGLDEKPELPPGSLSVYGDTGKAWTAFGILRIDPATVIVPLNMSVDIKVNARTYSDLTKSYSDIRFLIDNEGRGFFYNVGGLYTLDLRPYSTEYALDEAEGLVNEVWEDVSKLESLGFYVTTERLTLADYKNILNDARNKYDSAKRSSSEMDRNRLYNESFIGLRKAVTGAKFQVITRLEDMKKIAKYGAVVLPYIISMFPISLAFYFTESMRKKLFLTIILFPITFYVFYFLYPGFRLLDWNTFLLHFSASFLIALFVTFVVPRTIEAFERGRKSSAFSVFLMLFSVAKRFSKKRVTRTSLTIFSITLLIMSVVVLVSFSSVQEVVLEPFSGRRRGILVKSLPESLGADTPYMPINPDILYVLSGFEASNIAPIYMSTPLSKPMEAFNPNNVEGKVSVWGIMAVDTKNEPELTQMNSSTKVWFNDVINCLMSPRMARQLGVKTGDTVILKVGDRRVSFKVGVWSEYDVEDIDGSKLRPYKIVEVEKENKAVLVDTDEMFIVSIEALDPEIRKEFFSLYRVAFLLRDKVDEVMNSIISTYLYDVWYAPGGDTPGKHLKMGSRLEVRGIVESFITIIIVGLLVFSAMVSVIRERMKEIFTFVTVGANPTHIAMLFLAESMIMGFLGGLFGYFCGLSFYRVLALLGEKSQLIVRENLEWYWSIIGLFVAIGLSIAGAVKPSIDAAVMYSKAFRRKVALTGKEREKREEELFKIYQEMRESLPLRVTELELPFFTGFVRGRLTEISAAYGERVEEFKEEEVVEDGKSVKKLRFTYVWVEDGERYFVDSVMRAVELPNSMYSLEMLVKPRKPGIPAKVVFRPVEMVREMIKEWDEEKKRIMGR